MTRPTRRRLARLAGAGLLASATLALGAPPAIAAWPTPTPTPTATPVWTNTPTPVPTYTPTNTPTNTPTRTPVPPTNTPTHTPTNTPTHIPTSTPTYTPTPVPTSTPTATNTPPVGGSSNTVAVYLRAGNARAVAQCVNFARRHHGHNKQINRCRNVARADGGDVVLRNSRITALQTNTGTLGNPAASNVELTAVGGNATALAQCVNYVNVVPGRNKQVNQCTNIAVANGGTIVLVNVYITGVQLNS